MTDTDTLRQIARDDQQDTEARDLARQVSVYFQQLREAGVPEDQAAGMAATFNMSLLGRHFGVPRGPMDFGGMGL